MVSPELINIENRRETPLVVMDSNQLIFIKDKKTQSSLFKHAVFLVFTYKILEIISYSRQIREVTETHLYSSLSGLV